MIGLCTPQPARESQSPDPRTGTPLQGESEIYFAEAIRQPRRVPDPLLFELTRDLHSRSAHSDDRSPNHQWYYRLACECERRGHDLTQILKG